MGNKAVSDLFSVARATTATYFDSSGTLRYATFNTMRNDYNPATLAWRGILVEEARTNLYTLSQKLDSWSAPTNATITSGSTLLGLPAFDVSNIPNSSSYLSRTISLSTSTTYVRSCLAKAISGTTLVFEYYTGSQFTSVSFNLSTGVATGTGAKMISRGNGVYQCIHKFTTEASGSPYIAAFYIGAYGSTSTPTTIRMTAVQAEAGSFATSYIPTGNIAVTRNADDIKINTLSPWYNPSEGSLYIEWYADPDPSEFGSTQRWLGGFGTTNNNASGLFHNTSTGLSTPLYSGVSNTGDAFTSNILNYSAINKGIATYSGSNHKVCLNGGAVTTGGINFTQASVATALAIGQRNSNQRYYNGHIRVLKYIPYQVSEASMQSLTA